MSAAGPVQRRGVVTATLGLTQTLAWGLAMRRSA